MENWVSSLCYSIFRTSLLYYFCPKTTNRKEYLHFDLSVHYMILSLSNVNTFHCHAIDSECDFVLSRIVSIHVYGNQLCRVNAIYNCQLWFRVLTKNFVWKIFVATKKMLSMVRNIFYLYFCAILANFWRHEELKNNV